MRDGIEEAKWREIMAEADAARPPPGEEPEAPAAWPTLNPEALYGVAGDFVRLVEPHTEADPVAILVQFLVAIGNQAGRKIYRIAEAARHYTNLFTVIIGRTGYGR